jgi:hypothetical protein
MALKLNGGSMQPSSALKQEDKKQETQTQSNEPTVITRAIPTINPAYREASRKKEMVNHPDHYGGKENPYEAIKVIRAWDLSFSLGNTVKYIARAGKKDSTKRIEDLHKAMWYLQEEINNEYERSNK